MTRWEPEDRRLSAATFRSLADLWHHRVGSTPDGEAMCYRHDGGWVTITWREADQRVRAIGNALLAFGLQPEQRCSILSRTRVEWILADLGVLNAGGATTTIYPSSTSEECAWILAHSDSRLVFVEDQAQVDKLRAMRDQLPALERVVVFDGPGSEDGWVVPLGRFEDKGRAHEAAHPFAYGEAGAAIAPERLATLIYTSGTTGRPKGVELTHEAWVYEAEAMDLLGVLSPVDRQLLCLPLAHVFAKVLQVAFIRLGVPTIIDGDPATFGDTLRSRQPTWLAGVPRVFEKARDGVLQAVERRGRLARLTFGWALGVGEQVRAARARGDTPAPHLRARHALAHHLVLRRVQRRFGGQIRFFISGGAPLGDDVAQFFDALGMPILEGWGLTESAGASCVNRPGDVVLGTVGPPMPGCRVRVAPDGELLLQSRGVMRGYHKDPDATAAALTAEGWLRTGDIGAQLPSGHVRITDRKKDLIITAGGKNVAPTNFQSRLEAACPYVDDVLVIGDRRPYCVALITLRPETTLAWARAAGLDATTYTDLIGSGVVRSLIDTHIDAINATLPSFETVKAFAFLPEPLSLDDGTLTPTLKVKRRVVEQRYAHLIERLYRADEDHNE